jgi:hypothetical protein
MQHTGRKQSICERRGAIRVGQDTRACDVKREKQSMRGSAGGIATAVKEMITRDMTKGPDRVPASTINDTGHRERSLLKKKMKRANGAMDAPETKRPECASLSG